MQPWEREADPVVGPSWPGGWSRSAPLPSGPNAAHWPIGRRAADTAAGAFDDPADFAANTVFGRQPELDGVAVHVDCGTADGFYPAARAYADSLSPRPDGGFFPGGHNSAYWRRMAPHQLAFLGAHL